MQTQQKYYSPEEYLALEEVAQDKSEYIDGRIVPMVGGSTNHNQVAGNFAAQLKLAFKKLDYEVFIFQVRLWIPEKRIYTYPDVMIVAGELEYSQDCKDTIINPQVVAEVKRADRSGKFEVYRTIPTFEEYLLFDPLKIHMEQYSKTANKRWSLREYDAEDKAIILTSVDLQISLADLYNKVQFQSQEIKEN